ncbi:G-type lectin S-receptor-like serine/threonine-protein kinase At4g27290 [Arachis duranensis]|uniref:Receptor-like serine/threonine-protein kinase n=1 Tax=Arachis duranensis TaxID=130453 RepID=A0A6P4BAE2_ARADU|nr:G-type lectin S-receptor-like serine/threonine-protein kinase At4g27290 [Arachis duranensis]
MMNNLPFLFVLTGMVLPLLFFPRDVSSATDSISMVQPLHEGNTLVSSNGTFEMGFFSPGSSSNHYLGIWYKILPLKTVVWVANRSNPVKDNTSILHINNEGILQLVNKDGTVFWSTNSTTKMNLSNPIAQLLDSGNLVIRDENDEQDSMNYVWQSFDYPCDTLLPGMKLGWDLKTGLERRLTAWKNWDDPSPGNLSWGISLEGFPQGIFMKGSKEYYRVGPWNGLRFSGTPELMPNNLFSYKFVSNENEVYFVYNKYNLENKSSLLLRLVMNETLGNRHGYMWNDGSSGWTEFSSHSPREACDLYNHCGPNAYCSIISGGSTCQCLKGFKQKSSQNWTEGCSSSLLDEQSRCNMDNKTGSQRDDKNGFSKVGGMKYPDTRRSWVNESMNLDECRDKCRENCSCMAYANSDIREGGSGCLMWFGVLDDIKEFSDGGADIYIRTIIDGKEGHKKKKVGLIVTGTSASVLVVLLIFGYIGQRIINCRVKKNNDAYEDYLDLPIFDLATIAKATEDFSISNKLGKGGFGTVYKGTLVDGQNIAVKRLLQGSNSGQGLTEFMNEVLLIAKLQHRNLVKLLGCCIQDGEKMLVYEYMPNKSLDNFIFGHKDGRVILDWPNRFNIICGIARGLLYLHQDSRLRIIHRDLKASNVLLDKELNPKISDFGMAKSFGGNQTEGNTNRIVGTYGYMAPEYAIYGLFSIKSDVFSFGVLILEIVSGRKNRMISRENEDANLIAQAWTLWKEKKALYLIDSCMENSYVELEALRCIHTGLLCVQQNPEDRPNMSNVVMMLGSEVALPQPKEPSFLTETSLLQAVDSSSYQQCFSTNEISVTVLEAR